MLVTTCWSLAIGDDVYLVSVCRATGRTWQTWICRWSCPARQKGVCRTANLWFAMICATVSQPIPFAGQDLEAASRKSIQRGRDKFVLCLLQDTQSEVTESKLDLSMMNQFCIWNRMMEHRIVTAERCVFFLCSLLDWDLLACQECFRAIHWWQLVCTSYVVVSSGFILIIMGICWLLPGPATPQKTSKPTTWTALDDHSRGLDLIIFRQDNPLPDQGPFPETPQRPKKGHVFSSNGAVHSCSPCSKHSIQMYSDVFRFCPVRALQGCLRKIWQMRAA